MSLQARNWTGAKHQESAAFIIVIAPLRRHIWHGHVLVLHVLQMVLNAVWQQSGDLPLTHKLQTNNMHQEKTSDTV